MIIFYKLLGNCRNETSYIDPNANSVGNYETSAEELIKIDFKSEMDKIKVLLVKLINETKNKNLIINELDCIYKSIFKVTVENECKSSKASWRDKEIENLRNDNGMLRRELEECEFKYAKLVLSNEEVKNLLHIKCKRFDVMQKTLFQFQNELNGINKNTLIKTKSRSCFKTKPKEPSDNSLVNESVYDLVHDLLYLPKKLHHTGTTLHDIPKLNLVC
jgi:hypothetical protein